jgi:hypothetical protein
MDSLSAFEDQFPASISRTDMLFLYYQYLNPGAKVSIQDSDDGARERGQRT